MDGPSDQGQWAELPPGQSLDLSDVTIPAALGGGSPVSALSSLGGAFKAVPWWAWAALGGVAILKFAR